MHSLGLAKVYRSASAEGPYLRSFFGLPLKTIEEFVTREPASNEQIHKFSEYVYKNYIPIMARFLPSIKLFIYLN